MAETLSEIEQINVAQRELDNRKAEIMLTQITAFETLVNSADGKKFVAKLTEIANGMVESTSRNALNNVLTALSTAPMSMSFEKANFERTLAPPPPPPPAN